MTTQEKAKIILEKILELVKESEEIEVETDQLSLEDTFPVHELTIIFKYLKESGYIKGVQCIGSKYPDTVEITASGMDWVNGNSAETSVSQQIFNISGNNYGAVGTNTNFTINNSFDFDEFEKLITQNTVENSSERKELEEIKQQLQTITQHNIPISKGYLSKFSDVMQKNSWITGQLSGFLLRWIFGK